MQEWNWKRQSNYKPRLDSFLMRQKPIFNLIDQEKKPQAKSFQLTIFPSELQAGLFFAFLYRDIGILNSLLAQVKKSSNLVLDSYFVWP